ncbi:MAG: TonB-dependent receptor, partial [Acidobacteria bacterium]|nr:TonB-dependent receptor [Acidobacteriota bacterium]
DLLMGLPSLTGGARVDNHQHLRTESYNFFLQNYYRVRSDLTLSAGLRYEYNSPPVDVEDRANIYDPASQSLLPVGSMDIPRSGYGADKNNWGPRFGLAWTLGSGARTVLRAGYGVYYDQSALAPGEGLYFNAPFFDFRLFFPLPGLPLTLNDPFPEAFPFFLPSSALAFQRDLRTPYMQHWNLSVQRELGPRRVVEIGYAGSKGTKLLTARDINQPRPSPQVPNLRPVLQFDDINLLESRSNSSYHSLQIRLQQRLDSGLSLLSAYTWSKSLDDASSFFSSSGDPNFPQDSFNVQAERGRSNFDIRHRFSVSYSYSLPFGQGRSLLADRGWISGLLTGWQSNGILTFQSGRPFTVALLPEIDNSNTGRSILGFGANDRPHRVKDPALSNPTADRWFETTGFEIPAFGSFGDSGRNILDGPGFQSVNVSLLKDTTLREGVTLQFRAEAFNLFNRANFDLPDIFVGSPTFGRILSAGSPRRLQLGLKLFF